MGDPGLRTLLLTRHGILAKCLVSPDTIGMATRTIRLKLVVPRGADPERRQARWASHAAINEAARYYERQLLLMRQREYETEAGVVTSDKRDRAPEPMRGSLRGA